MSGNWVGDYELTDVIGHGATGRVWRARHLGTGSDVAVKVLRGEYADDPEARARFLAEARLLIDLQPAGSVRVLASIDEVDAPAIVMEIIEAPTLRELLSKEGQMGPARAARLCCALASSLTAAHACGLVHGDVKPENVMVRAPGSVDEQTVLMDFGLARVLEDSSVTHSRSQVIGTPHYAAPEIHSGVTAHTPADVYAVGVMLYEAIVGRRPFEAPTTLGIIHKHLNDEPQRTGDFSQALWEAASACLVKNPAERPSADEVAARLRTIVDQGLVHPEALPTTTWTRTASPSEPSEGKNRRLFHVAAVAALVLVAGGTTYVVVRNAVSVDSAPAAPDRVEPIASRATATSPATPDGVTTVSSSPTATTSGAVGVPVPEKEEASTMPPGKQPVDVDPPAGQPPAPPAPPVKPEVVVPRGPTTTRQPSPPPSPTETFPQFLEVPNKCTSGNMSFEVTWVVTRTRDTHIWQRAYVKINAPSSMGKQVVRLHLWESGTDRIMLPFTIPVNERKFVNLGNAVTERKRTETRAVIWLKGDSSRERYCDHITKW